MSFVNNGGRWPAHCIQSTDGANIHPAVELNKDKDFIVHKGTDSKYESYSAFYNSKEIGSKSTLHNILEENNISSLYVCGVGAEFCVYSTLLDAIKDKQIGYKCYLIKDATIGLDDDKIQKCYAHLQKLGIRIIGADDIN
jgi:nicotinamidase/pyrazinamidase